MVWYIWQALPTDISRSWFGIFGRLFLLMINTFDISKLGSVVQKLWQTLKFAIAMIFFKNRSQVKVIHFCIFERLFQHMYQVGKSEIWKL